MLRSPLVIAALWVTAAPEGIAQTQETPVAPEQVCLTNACGPPLALAPVTRQATIQAAIDRGDLRTVLQLEGSAREALAALASRPDGGHYLTLLDTARFARSRNSNVIAVRVPEGHWNYIVRNELDEVAAPRGSVDVCTLPGALLQPPCRPEDRR